MGIKDTAINTASELIKSDNIQNKISDVCSMLFPYMGITKKAVDMYLSDIEKSNLPRDSKIIAMFGAKKHIKQLQNQQRIAEISISSAKEETSFDTSSEVDSDWVDRYMDAAKFVSDEKVQLIWGKILAKEFEEPGSTPPNMIRILSEITPKCAHAFQLICCMNLFLFSFDKKVLSSHIVVPYSDCETDLQKMGITFPLLTELDTLGLIKFNVASGYVLHMSDPKLLAHINGLTKEIHYYPQNALPIGNVMLTEAGYCLMRILNKEPIESYDTMAVNYLCNHHVIFEASTNYSLTINQNGTYSIHDSERINNSHK